MIPLTLAQNGDLLSITKIGGKSEVRKHLENLGFVSGVNVSIISILGGNMIVRIKESRIAISKEMAQKIYVS